MSVGWQDWLHCRLRLPSSAGCGTCLRAALLSPIAQPLPAHTNPPPAQHTPPLLPPTLLQGTQCGNNTADCTPSHVVGVASQAALLCGCTHSAGC